MRTGNVVKNKSSFLGLQKDTSLIISKILDNPRLLKLIYYNTRDWKTKPDLTSDQIKSLFAKKQISNIPQLKIDDQNNRYNYLRISFTDFIPNEENSFYRNSVIEIKIICPFDTWDLNDFQLRPYLIAGEIDSMLQGTHFSGIGLLQLLSGSQDVYDDEFGGLTLRYLAVGGNEDKVNPLSD